MRVAILQSNYVPWKGYFDLIAAVDHFVLYDDAQYTKNDWRNRNRIKTAQGLRWLTIPVQSGGRFGQRIRDTQVQGDTWRRSHWRTLTQSYARAPHFGYVRAAFEELYLGGVERSLSLINRAFLERACELLGIRTAITWSHEHPLVEGRIERLLGLCAHLGAREYLSGPAARDYLDPAVFQARGITVRWMDYSGYREYPQLHGPFEHGVSVLDLLFQEGPRAGDWMKHVRAGGAA